MNQYELIERLKEVAEYDSCELYSKNNSNNILSDFYKHKIPNEVQLYDVSFDWSIPVYLKACKEANKKLKFGVLLNFKVSAINKLNDPLQFFINLSDLIREIKKYK